MQLQMNSQKSTHSMIACIRTCFCYGLKGDPKHSVVTLKKLINNLTVQTGFIIHLNPHQCNDDDNSKKKILKIYRNSKNKIISNIVTYT